MRSNFEILAEPLNDGSENGHLFSRAYRLDNNGRDKVVEYGKMVGQCGECSDGTIRNGLRVTMKGNFNK